MRQSSGLIRALACLALRELNNHKNNSGKTQKATSGIQPVCRGFRFLAQDEKEERFPKRKLPLRRGCQQADRRERRLDHARTDTDFAALNITSATSPRRMRESAPIFLERLLDQK